MRILHFSYADIMGGSSVATYQIHSLLREAGHESLLAVCRKDSDGDDVLPLPIRPVSSLGPKEICRRMKAKILGYSRVKVSGRNFNRNLAPSMDLDAALQRMPKPDAVFLHLVAGMLNVRDIAMLYKKVDCPLVWMVLDAEPFTGGCHYPGACLRYRTACGCCPQLVVPSRNDLANTTWREKQRCLSGLPITFVVPSPWTFERLKESSLFGQHKAEKILLPINKTMRPFPMRTARELLGLPLDKRIVLVGSQKLTDPRKGMTEFIEAARILASADARKRWGVDGKELLFLVIGAGGKELREKIPFDVHDAGRIRSMVELALMYQAADLFASPSTEDAGPSMISESMLCGTPVVAFDMGLAQELIEHQVSGYIAKLRDAGDFANGLGWMLANRARVAPSALESINLRQSRAVIAKAYDDLLKSLAESGTGQSSGDSKEGPGA